MNNLTKLARKLRNNPTKQEQKLWNLLKKRQIKNFRFRRQYNIGNYIVDFICREKKIIIELDGGQHNEIDNILYDQERTKYLEEQGYKIIRFWNDEIDNNIDGVYEKLLEILD